MNSRLLLAALSRHLLLAALARRLLLPPRYKFAPFAIIASAAAGFSYRAGLYMLVLAR